MKTIVSALDISVNNKNAEIATEAGVSDTSVRNYIDEVKESLGQEVVLE